MEQVKTTKGHNYLFRTGYLGEVLSFLNTSISNLRCEKLRKTIRNTILIEIQGFTLKYFSILIEILGFSFEILGILKIWDNFIP